MHIIYIGNWLFNLEKVVHFNLLCPSDFVIIYTHHFSPLNLHYIKYRNFIKFFGVENLWKRAVSAEFKADCKNFPHHEIRWSFSILHNASILMYNAPKSNAFWVD